MHKKALSVVAVSGALVLSGCSAISSDVVTPQGTVTDAPMTTPFATVEVGEPVYPDQLDKPEKDPGLNVTWTLQGVSSAPNTGNAVISVLIRNDNEGPLSPKDIPQPTLKVAQGNDENDLTEVEPESDEASGITSGLDLPLGSGAATNVLYAFKTAPTNLWSAEFKTGSVVWHGKLH